MFQFILMSRVDGTSLRRVGAPSLIQSNDPYYKRKGSPASRNHLFPVRGLSFSSEQLAIFDPHEDVADEKKMKTSNNDTRKEAFLSPYWVEERHDYIKTLNPKAARDLLKSLTDDEESLNVNHRQFQEAYICDYLDYLWGIDRDSFWRHIVASFHHPDGTLMSDNNFHIDVMKHEHLPEKVWLALLDSLFYAPIGELGDINKEIIRVQLESSATCNEAVGRIQNWLSTFDQEAISRAHDCLEAHGLDASSCARSPNEVLRVLREFCGDTWVQIVQE